MPTTEQPQTSNSHYDMRAKKSWCPDAPKICLTKEEARYYYPTPEETDRKKQYSERKAFMRAKLGF